MDELVFHWINGMAGRLAFLDGVMIFLAEWPSMAGPLLLLGLWFLPGRERLERRIAAVLAVLATLIALGFCDLPTLLYSRPRPFETGRAVVLVRRVTLPSFPSTHVAGATALVAGLGTRLGRWNVLAWALTGSMMVGRVYVGVHYPVDVLGGLVTGWIAGASVYHNRDVLRPFALRVVTFGEELL